MKLAIAIALIPLLLNVFATRLIHRDEYSEKARKIAQLLFVWLVPVIGRSLSGISLHAQILAY